MMAGFPLPQDEKESLPPSDPLEPENLGEGEAVNALTEHFRRTSRGRVVDLPRWAQ